MEKLLIIHRKQFGYHTDSYKLALNLQEDFEITFLCFDSGFDKFECESVNVKYVDNNGMFLKRFITFIIAAAKEQRRKSYQYVFLNYFPLCCLLRFLSNTMVLDFRTGSVRKNRFRRLFDDGLASFESLFFNRVTVISEGLRQLLRISKKKAFILPLGADVLSTINKQFDSPRLFYIGTFNNRQLEKTLEGVALYLKEHPNKKLEYHIVGSGFRGEDEALKKQVKMLGLQNCVTFYGAKKHTEVQGLFDSCNIGVSFVPITPYFDHQPPTKTFEYAMAGMAVLATATSENKKIINDDNGILHQDTPEAFCQGLELCVKNFPTLNSVSIKKTVESNSWSIISPSLKEYLLNGK